MEMYNFRAEESRHFAAAQLLHHVRGLLIYKGGVAPRSVLRATGQKGAASRRRYVRVGLGNILSAAWRGSAESLRRTVGSMSGRVFYKDAR